MLDSHIWIPTPWASGGCFCDLDVLLRDYVIDFCISVIIQDNCPVSQISFLAFLNDESWAPLAHEISCLLLGNSD